MVETERLILRPLDYGQLIKYINGDSSLELELNLKKSRRVISPELKEALEETILPNVADSKKNYLYSTLWALISKELNKIVGDICIVGEPNKAGEIEIGYGTYEGFMGNGYMKEGVGGIIEWARTQPKVLSVAAYTDKENIASCTILSKNGFKKTGERKLLHYWKLVL
jgi:[ribosomal protein S5]-alanine N-acetyltransferase